MGKAKDYIPALKYGHKIMPEDLAGMLGLPHVGNIYYVDPTNGSDTANSGTSQNDALKTLRIAEDKTTDNNHDVVVIVPGEVGSGSGTAETANITWDKDNTHLIGSSAPVALSNRARIITTTDSVDPCITISGHGNTFRNVQFATYEDSNDVLINLTGDRNYFENVHFAGIGSATCGDDSTARCLAMSGAAENRFVNCTFGMDTIARSTTNATVEFASASTRNIFEYCRFIMWADNVGPNHILFTGSSAIDRWIQFDNCTWYAFWTNDADKVTHVMDLAAQTATGHVLMTGRQIMVGFDDWEATDSDRIFFEPATATANAIGIGINPSVS